MARITVPVADQSDLASFHQWNHRASPSTCDHTGGRRPLISRYGRHLGSLVDKPRADAPV